MMKTNMIVTSPTLEELVKARHNDDGHGQKFAEGEDDLDTGRPAHTHTVEVHDGGYTHTHTHSDEHIYTWLSLKCSVYLYRAATAIAFSHML